jgi:hypothetical protein
MFLPCSSPYVTVDTSFSASENPSLACPRQADCIDLQVATSMEPNPKPQCKKGGAQQRCAAYKQSGGFLQDFFVSAKYDQQVYGINHLGHH